MSSIIDSLKSLISKYEKQELVLKKIDADEQRLIGVVLEPDVVDLHGDTYSAEEVRKACDNFNTHCMATNLQHVLSLSDGEAEIEKSFILEVDARIGDQSVKAGTWVQQWKIKNETLWDSVKDGKFTGFSIGCVAEVEVLE